MHKQTSGIRSKQKTKRSTPDYDHHEITLEINPIGKVCVCRGVGMCVVVFSDNAAAAATRY